MEDEKRYKKRTDGFYSHEDENGDDLFVTSYNLVDPISKKVIYSYCDCCGGIDDLDEHMIDKIIDELEISLINMKKLKEEFKS